MTTKAGVSDPSFLKRLEASVQMALSRAAQGLIAFIAGANNVSAIAAATGVAAVVPYVAIAAPSITKKASGKYLVVGFVTVDKNAGTLADGDAVVLQPFVNGVELGTFQAATGAVTSGATVQAYVAFGFIAAAGGAGPFVIDMRVTTAGAHTSAVLVNNGFIAVIELPA